MLKLEIGNRWNRLHRITHRFSTLREWPNCASVRVVFFIKYIVLTYFISVIRSGKSSTFQSTYPTAGDRLQVVEITDLTDSDLTEACKGEIATHITTPSSSNNLSVRHRLPDSCRRPYPCR